MMILQVRHGRHTFEVDVPRGSAVHTGPDNLPVLIVPSPCPEETSTWIPAAEILSAARLGLFGMSLRADHRPAACA